MDNKEWLSNLKTGDPVYIDGSNNLGGYKRIEKVSRVTKTQIVIGGLKFRKDDGTKVGDRWFTTRIEFPTPERHNEVRKQALIWRLKKVPWENHSLVLLEKVWKEIETGRIEK